MHPLKRKKENTRSSVKAAARKLPHILSTEDINEIGDEWLMYQAEDEIKDSWFRELVEAKSPEGSHEIKHLRVDTYWAKVLDVKTSTGLQKYPTLGKFVKAVLTISLGQAEVERGFCINKHTLTSKRVCLSEASVMVCDPSRML